MWYECRMPCYDLGMIGMPLLTLLTWRVIDVIIYISVDFEDYGYDYILQALHAGLINPLFNV